MYIRPVAILYSDVIEPQWLYILKNCSVCDAVADLAEMK